MVRRKRGTKLRADEQKPDTRGADQGERATIREALVTNGQAT
jgi:hypothetical protein